MQKAIFPGSFDPPTRGHLNIVCRAAKLFDRLYVAVGSNITKKETAFTPEERVRLWQVMIKDIPNIEVVAFDGLLADFAKELNVSLIIRSLRNVSDFEHEMIQAEMNAKLGSIETLYMVAEEKHRLISSTLVREIARFGKRLHPFVPDEIEEAVFQRLSQLS